MNPTDSQPYSWLWDVPILNAEFDAILAGGPARGTYDRDWAALRLIEYASYREIRRRLPDAVILALWPGLAPRVRSRTRREGMDFLYQWLTERAA